MKAKKKRYLKLRRKKVDGSIKASVHIHQPTTLLIYKQAKKLIQVFGSERYCFDISDFAELYVR